MMRLVCSLILLPFKTALAERVSLKRGEELGIRNWEFGIWKAGVVTLLFLFLIPSSLLADNKLRGDMLVVVGSSGTDEYGKLFATWSQRWEQAAEQASFSFTKVEPPVDEETAQKDSLSTAIQMLKSLPSRPLWIILIGHGTYDGRSAKFNLKGPDLSAEELAELLKPFERELIVINCSSASAPYLEKLSRNQRVIITSTRAGEQLSFSRFGEYISTAITSPDHDLDKDEQVSLLEAFLAASRQTLAFYESDGRIPTENALLDDNADGKGTRAAAFQGVRHAQQPEEEGVILDGFRAHQIHLLPNELDLKLTPEQIAQRDSLERKIEELRLQKKNLEEDVYYDRLEVLLLEMAELLLKIEEVEASDDSESNSAETIQ